MEYKSLFAIGVEMDILIKKFEEYVEESASSVTGDVIVSVYRDINYHKNQVKNLMEMDDYYEIKVKVKEDEPF